MVNLCNKIKGKLEAETTCPKTFPAFLKATNTRKSLNHSNIKKETKKANPL